MYSNLYPGQHYAQQNSTASCNQHPQQNHFSSSSLPTYEALTQALSQQGTSTPFNSNGYQNQYQPQSYPAQPSAYLATSQSQPMSAQHAMQTPASSSYSQTNSFYPAAQAQPAHQMLSTQTSYASSGNSMAHPSASFSSTASAEHQTGSSMFGGDYVTGTDRAVFVVSIRLHMLEHTVTFPVYIGLPSACCLCSRYPRLSCCAHISAFFSA